MSEPPAWNWINWRELIESLVDTPFVWGESDCLCLAMQLADALYGTDFYNQHRAKYSDEASAVAYLESLGGFEQAVTDAGGQFVDLKWLTRGDWLVTAWDVDSMLPQTHVYQGATCVCTDEARGSCFFVPTTTIRKMNPIAVRMV